MELQDIHKEILALCADDHTGFWLIAKRVARNDSFDKSSQWARRKTLEVIRSLLQIGLIEAGNFEPEDSGGFRFQPMVLPIEDVINFIEREWDELDRAPTIGDICWFKATSNGKQLAHEMGLKS